MAPLVRPIMPHIHTNTDTVEEDKTSTHRDAHLPERIPPGSALAPCGWGNRKQKEMKQAGMLGDVWAGKSL